MCSALTFRYDEAAIIGAKCMNGDVGEAGPCLFFLDSGGRIWGLSAAEGVQPHSLNYRGDADKLSADVSHTRTQDTQDLS